MLIALRLLAFLSNTSASSSHGKMPGTPLTVGFLGLPMAFICQGFQGENSSIISSTQLSNKYHTTEAKVASMKEEFVTKAGYQ